MQQLIKDVLKKSLDQLVLEKGWQIDENLTPQVEYCRDPEHGDFASNIAMMLSKAVKMPPRQIAESLINQLPSSDEIVKIEVAGPGFINFTLKDSVYHRALLEILNKKSQYGQSTLFKGQKVYLEFVSANPTGPLHVGHGRSAAYSSCVGNLLANVGYEVHREYYVNDAGRQMSILALSTWLRYLMLQGESVSFPENAYQGEYIIDIARQIEQSEGNIYFHKKETLDQVLTTLNIDTSNKEAMIDGYISAAQQILGKKAFLHIQTATLETILDEIRQDLTEFGVEFDNWFYESQLMDLGLVEQGIGLLKEQGYVYERDGAIWFAATHFGDEKDRVLVRENGQTTYFASDVAYHLYKYNQNFDQYIDVFGADHHGYIARIRAFLQGLGKDPEKLKIRLVQFVTLFRGKEKISMSTRSGSFITLRELREEVGNDATRFFYIFRKQEQHLDFDLELAKKHSNDNPVYYIQYAYARICSVWRQMNANHYEWQQNQGEAYLSLLDSPHEKLLIRQIIRYPEVIELAAIQYAPHSVTHYLHEVAHLFHSYYNNERFLVEDEALRNARLCLIKAIQQVFVNGLSLLGLGTPEQM